MKNLVDTRKSGNMTYYRLRDRQVNDLLAVARHMFDAHLVQVQSMSVEESPSHQPKAPRRRRARLTA